MREFDTFILEQEVKDFMYADYEEFVETINMGGYFPCSNFNLKHFETLENLLLNNEENKLVYGELRDHLYDMVDFLDEYLEVDEYNISKYQKATSRISFILDNLKPVSFTEYLFNELQSRFNYQEKRLEIEKDKYELLIQNIFDSNSMDLENTVYLCPNNKVDFKVTDYVQNHYLLLSLSYFFSNHPNLFTNSVVNRRIRLILMKMINHDYKNDEELGFELKDKSQKLLKKINSI